MKTGYTAFSGALALLIVLAGCSSGPAPQSGALSREAAVTPASAARVVTPVPAAPVPAASVPAASVPAADQPAARAMSGGTAAAATGQPSAACQSVAQAAASTGVAQAPAPEKPAARTAAPQGTAGAQSPAPSASSLSQEDRAFVERNIASITVTKLDNGIPVYLKRNTENRVCAIKAVLNGHAVFIPAGKAGLEAITLSAMARGSARYSYDDIRSFEYTTSSGIGGNAGSYDLSSFDLVTLDKYFDRLFDVWADCFLHPSFDPKQFSQVMNNYNIVYRKAMADPYERATVLLHADAFAGTPYAADPRGTEASLASITLDDAKGYYRSTFVPGRLSIVAVGNFDEASLIGKLNATFGRLAGKGIVVPTPPPLAAKGDLIVSEYPASEGVAYLRGEFPLPAVSSPDFVTASFAFSMLDDLLSEKVRTEHGAAYSVWADAYPAKAPYGCIGVYKTAVPEKVKGYVDEAVGILASGRCMAAGSHGSGSYVPIAEAIEFYKAKYVTAFYSAQETNTLIAAQLANSAVLTGDHTWYLRVAGMVDAIRPADVVRVVNAWLSGAKVRWIVLGGKDLVGKVNRSDFVR